MKFTPAQIATIRTLRGSNVPWPVVAKELKAVPWDVVQQTLPFNK